MWSTKTYTLVIFFLLFYRIAQCDIFLQEVKYYFVLNIFLRSDIKFTIMLNYTVREYIIFFPDPVGLRDQFWKLLNGFIMIMNTLSVCTVYFGSLRTSCSIAYDVKS